MRAGVFTALPLIAACTSSTVDLLAPDATGKEPAVEHTDADLRDPSARDASLPAPGDAEPESDTGAIDLADYCRRLRDLEIARSETCFGIEPARMRRFLDETSFFEECTTPMQSIFDPAMAEQCLTELSAETCADFFYRDAHRHLASCANTRRGMLPLGSTCRHLHECESGSICDTAAPYGRCTFRCIPDHGTVAEGWHCRALYDCDEGLVCRDEILRRVCVALEPALGEPCTLTPGFCGPEATCSRNTWRCVPAIPDGAPCAHNFDCPLFSICSPAGTCAPRKRRGETCAAGDHDCSLVTFCSAQNVCEPLGIEGDRCTGRHQCRPEYWCDRSSGTCVVERRDGERCTDGDQCRAGICSGEVCSTRCY